MTASVGRRVTRRLCESPVPVRTAVLVAELGVPRSQVWDALLCLERAGRAVRTKVWVASEPAAPCPCCGRKARARKGGWHTFWELKRSAHVSDRT